MHKINCWEFHKCGREPDGANVYEMGICPTSIEERLDGVHGGKNAGRACWVVVGTMCNGEPQGGFAEKIRECSDCDFYRLVREEEGEDSFTPTITLLSWIE